MKGQRAVAVVASGVVAALTVIGVIGRGDSRPPRPRLIPQPPLTTLNARTRRRLAPASRRVDLVARRSRPRP